MRAMPGEPGVACLRQECLGEDLMQTHWRLAFMFDAVDGDLDRLTESLVAARDAILAATSGHHVRVGILIPAEDGNQGSAAHAAAVWRPVDGAIEVTIANGGEPAIPGICRA